MKTVERVELFICLFFIVPVLHNNSKEAFIIRFKVLTFLGLKGIAGFEYGMDSEMIPVLCRNRE